MPHPLRMYEPDRVYEVTSRIQQGRFLLRPSPAVNDIFIGIVGRARQLYPDVRLYGCVFLSNHVTWLLASPRPRQIPRFLGYVNGRVSSEVGRLHDWPGRNWSRPARPIPIVDDESLVDRFRYVLAQGCKEHLVASPREWPGVTCVKALLGSGRLDGHWYDRDAQTKARRRNKPSDDHLFATPYSITFDKIPCWQHLSDDDYREQVERLVVDIENTAAQARMREGKRVLGVQRILAQSPHHRPGVIAKSPAPLCHAATRRARDAYRVLYRVFVDAFRQAADTLRKAARLAQLRVRGKAATQQPPQPVTFPLYAFPPPIPCLDHAATTVTIAGQHET